MPFAESFRDLIAYRKQRETAEKIYREPSHRYVKFRRSSLRLRALYDEPRSGGKKGAPGAARYERNPGVAESLLNRPACPSARALRFVSGRIGLMAPRASAASFLWPDAPIRAQCHRYAANHLSSANPGLGLRPTAWASRMSPLTRLVPSSLPIVHQPKEFEKFEARRASPINMKPEGPDPLKRSPKGK